MRNCIKIFIVLAICILAAMVILIGLNRAKISHIVHLIYPPKNYYTPILLEEFKLYEEGYTKTFILSPKYSGIYAIGIMSTRDGISSEDTFNGVLIAEFLLKDNIVIEKISNSQLSAIYADSNMKLFRKVVLIRFEVPMLDKQKEEIGVRLTVLRADEKFRKYADSTKLFVGINPTP